MSSKQVTATEKRTTSSRPRAHTSAAKKRSAPRKQQWAKSQVEQLSLERFHIDEDHRPFAQTNNEVSLPCLLKALTKKQLIDLIVYRLMANIPNAEKKLRSQLPMPDVESLLDDLKLAKRNIYRSLPAARYCQTDSVAHARAANALAHFKATLGEHTQQLHDSENWDALTDYVTTAWEIVQATPIWDSIMHNGTRGECFKILSINCIEAVQHAGLRLGALRLIRLERKIPEWSKDFADIQRCTNAINRAVNKATRIR